MLQPVFAVVTPDTYPKTNHESCFKYIDPELLQNGGQRHKFCELFGNGTYSLITKVIQTCSQLQTGNSDQLSFTPKFLNNLDFKKLANTTFDCFCIGYKENFEEFFSIVHMKDEADWEDYAWHVQVGYWAIDWRPFRPAQVIAMCSLFVLDEALLNISKHGFNKENSNLLLLAYEFLELAISEDNSIFERESSRFEKSNAAKKRYRDDPKQIAKSLIKTHWEEWQSDPMQYKGAAAFARDMLDAYPIITSHKKVTEWCTDWKKEVTMRA